MTVEDSLHELETASYFGVLRYLRSYTNLLYVFLTFSIGLTFFIYAAVCFPLFIGLSFTIVGLFLLYIFLWSLPRLMLVIGYLTEFLVGLPVPIKDYTKEFEGSFITKAFNALKDKRIGKSLIYSLILALPYGTFVFSIMTFLISFSGALIAIPIVFAVQYGLGTLETWEQWFLNNLPNWAIIIILILAFLVGLGLIPAILQLSNKLAILHAKMVEKALVR